MRIALVAEDYYPQLGGVPEHVHNLALQLNAWGHTAAVVTSHMGDYPDADFVRRVGTSRVIYANGGVSRVTTGWRLRRRLEELFRAERYDPGHVHGGLPPPSGLAAPFAAWPIGFPVVATFPSWFARAVGCRVFRRPLQKILDRHAATIAVSARVVEANARYFDADWEIIPNGVDTSFFKPNGRRPTDALTDRPRLLFLGRIEPRNGLGTLLDAMPHILARYPRALLTVAGDGPWRGYYERRGRELGASVRFVGKVFEDRPDYYGSADLYLCPTHIASFGVTLLEAMACGTPMVVADNHGYRSVVDGGAEALIVSKDDPKIWAESQPAPGAGVIVQQAREPARDPEVGQERTQPGVVARGDPRLVEPGLHDRRGREPAAPRREADALGRHGIRESGGVPHQQHPMARDSLRPRAHGNHEPVALDGARDDVEGREVLLEIAMQLARAATHAQHADGQVCGLGEDPGVAVRDDPDVEARRARAALERGVVDPDLVLERRDEVPPVAPPG